MTMKKLLTGVALATLLSGAALAQVDITRAAATDDNLPLRITGAGSNGTVAFSASEFQPAAAAQLTGTVVIGTTFGAVAPFNGAPVDARVRLTVTLTNATWTSAGGGTNDGGLGACAFQTAPVGGGGVGNNSLEFLSVAAAGINACTGVGPTFTFANIRRVNSGQPITVNFEYRQVGADGSAVAAPIVRTDSVLLADTAAAWGTGAAAGHSFTAGGELLATGAGILAAGNLGTVSTSFRTTAPATAPAADPRDIRVGATGGAVIAAASLFQATNNNIVITFPNGVGRVNGVAIAGTAGPCTGPVANAFTCPLTPAEVTGLNGNVISYMVAAGAIATPEQTVTATLNTNPQTGYVAGGFTGNLATIKHDDGLRVAGIAVPEGDWVGFGSTPTESQFRISGLTATQAASIQQIRVTVEGGNNVSSTAPATPLVLTNTGDLNTGFAVRGSTVVFNSKGLGAAAGLVGNGNANITAVNLQFTEAGMGGVALPVTAQLDRQIVNRTPGTLVAVPGNN